jgi:ApbE superfamily uncharacterized protein (UPF0280 family)
MYQPRTYRNWVKNSDLVAFQVIVEETDCYISALSNLESKARKAILKYRSILKKYIRTHPLFLTTLEPFAPQADDPLIVKAMCAAGQTANVGPMAAVAGAIAHFAGLDLLPSSRELIIENGGDIFLNSDRPRLAAIFAGSSPLSGKIGFEIESQGRPLGISTSSGTVGHSLSFGRVDALTVLAEDALLSDAAATALANLIQTAEDIPACLEKGRGIKGVRGIAAIKGETAGFWGELKLRPLQV